MASHQSEIEEEEAFFLAEEGKEEEPSDVGVQVDEVPAAPQKSSPEDEMERSEARSTKALGVTIQSCGDYIRELQMEDASKEDVDQGSKILFNLEELYKKRTGCEWKQAPLDVVIKEKRKSAVAEASLVSSNTLAQTTILRSEVKVKVSNVFDPANDTEPDYSEGMYGFLEMNMSRKKPFKFVNVNKLTPELKGQDVWIRGQLIESTPSVQRCSFILRQEHSTVQCVAGVEAGKLVSIQMVRFVHHLPIATVVDIKGTVKTFNVAILGCSQKDVLINVQEAWIVTAVYRDPLRREDGGHRITLEGTARKSIDEVVQDLENQVTIECVIEQQHHRTNMGTPGSKVQKICSDFDVQIKIPDRASKETETNGKGEKAPPALAVDVNNQLLSRKESSEDSTITAYEKTAIASKDAVLETNGDFEITVKEEVEINHRVYSMIFGRRRKIMSDFSVDIRLPRQGDANPNLVTVVGSNEDQVSRCIKRIVSMSNKDFKDEPDDWVEDYAKNPTKDHDHHNLHKRSEPKGLEVVEGSPWQGASVEAFNTQGGPAAGTSVSTSD